MLHNYSMIVETFGPYLHQGMMLNVHRLCGGCGCRRGQSYCVRRGQEPTHICTLASADAFKYRRWELTMELMRKEPDVSELMKQLIDKVRFSSCMIVL